MTPDPLTPQHSSPGSVTPSVSAPAAGTSACPDSITKEPCAARSGADHRTNSPVRDDTRLVVVLFSIMVVLLLGIAASPWLLEWANDRWAPKTRQYLGAAQRVRYSGSWRVNTEVQTESHTFLLNGAVLIAKGVGLERRARLLDADDVCVVGSDVCHGLRSQ